MSEVSTARELVAALKAASDGDTVALAPGVYSDVALKSLQFAQAVTITSADPNNPAVLVDMEVTSVKGLIIQDVVIKAVADVGLKIFKSENITVDNVEVTGPSLVNLGGSGLKVDQSTSVVVQDSSFHHLGYGFTHIDSQHVTFTGNTLENIRVDGIRGGGTSWIEISGNTLSNFYRNAGEHGDAIQFWTMNTKASAHDIIVKDNLIHRGDGQRMQGIFMGDETKGRLPYLDVEISGNTILGSMYNGISLDSAKGAVISGNTVIGYQDMKAWIRLDDSTDVVMSNNISSSYSIPANGNVNLVRVDNETVALTTSAESVGLIAQHFQHLLDLQAPPIPDAFDNSAFSGGYFFNDWLFFI